MPSDNDYLRGIDQKLGVLVGDLHLLISVVMAGEVGFYLLWIFS